MLYARLGARVVGTHYHAGMTLRPADARSRPHVLAVSVEAKPAAEAALHLLEEVPQGPPSSAAADPPAQDAHGVVMPGVVDSKAEARRGVAGTSDCRRLEGDDTEGDQYDARQYAVHRPTVGAMGGSRNWACVPEPERLAPSA